MLSTIVSLVGLAAAVVSIIYALRYALSGAAETRLFRDMTFAEGEAVKPAAAAYRALDRSRRRLMLPVLIAFVLVIIGSILVRDHKTALQIANMVGVAAAMAISQFAAFHFNMKRDEIRIEADVQKRYRDS